MSKVDDFQVFFDSLPELPKDFKLSECEVIVDVELFVETHISFLRANAGNRLFLPYYLRLDKLYKLIKKNHE
jgi:hypothetical protein